MPQFAPLGRLPEHRGMIGGGAGESRLVCGENSAISGAFLWRPKSGPRVRSAQSCQCPQRLWKVLHRNDPDPVGIAPGLTGVLTGRNEEDVHTRLAHSE